MTGSTFTFSGFETPESDDPLGIWDLAISELEVAPATAYNAVEQAAQKQAAQKRERGLVWRVDHPESSLAAHTELLEQRAKVDRWEADLEAAARRLGGLSPRLSYAASSSDPEQALWAEVAALQSPVLSYGLDNTAHRVYEEVFERASSLLVQFKRLVYHFARIETTSGGTSIALTTVDWTGDYETAWLDGATTLEMTLHLEAVRLALASRHALLRLISVVTSGAMTLTAKASVPGGQVLLIPAVYNYVRSILREFEQWPAGAS